MMTATLPSGLCRNPKSGRTLHGISLDQIHELRNGSFLELCDEGIRWRPDLPAQSTATPRPIARLPH